jgi:hypothetical protein
MKHNCTSTKLAKLKKKCINTSTDHDTRNWVLPMLGKIPAAI